jgi:hypothetical protein
MNTLENVMETKGVAGYTGQVKLITEELFRQVDPTMTSSFNMVFDMLDLFQAENVHRLRSGTAIKSEKYVLKYLKRQAEEFLQRLEKYDQSYESRILFRPLPPLSLDRTPEDLFPKIMSYLSPIVRLENLRRKYTNEFLINGLRKKKIGQLKYIHQQYEDTIYDTPNQSEELYGLCGWIDVICDSISHITNYVEEYKYKHIRVEGIVKMYLVVEDHLMNTLIKSSVYDTYCNFAIKMLHLLVIACRQNTPKKIRGCHDARIMTKVPYTV